jgi:hypothetical protein
VGQQGFQGFQGNGAQGGQGTQGSQGFQGTTGTPGSQGFQGFQGFQGDQGPGGVLATFNAFDSASQTVASGLPVSVPTVSVSQGSAIVQFLGLAQFTLNTSGIYRESFVLQTSALTTLGQVAIVKNGLVVPGSPVTLSASGSEMVGSTTFTAATGDVVQLEVEGLLPISLNTASVSLDQLSG